RKLDAAQAAALGWTDDEYAVIQLSGVQAIEKPKNESSLHRYWYAVCVSATKALENRELEKLSQETGWSVPDLAFIQKSGVKLINKSDDPVEISAYEEKYLMKLAKTIRRPSEQRQYRNHNALGIYHHPTTGARNPEFDEPVFPWPVPEVDRS